MEGAPVVVHGGQSPHVVNGGQIIQKLEVLCGSQLGVNTAGRSPHQRIKYIVVGWMGIIQAFRDERGEQSAAARPAAQDGHGRIRMVEVPQATNARRRQGTAALHGHVGQTQKSEQYC